MEECYVKYGVREMDVFDPLFTINKKRVIKVCKEIQRRGLKIAWSCRSRVDTIDWEMLNEMKKAGCYRIYYGIESGDETILKNIKKFTKLSQIKKSIKLTNEVGILPYGYFMFGSPGETEKSIENTIRLALELPLRYAQFNRLSSLPGTDLYEELKIQLKTDYWRDYILDKKATRELPRVGCDLSDDILNRFIKRAYMRFYFRPKIIFNFLLEIKSITELARYIKAAYGMITTNSQS